MLHESDFWKVYGIRRPGGHEIDWWWSIGSNIPMGPYPDATGACLALMEKVNDMQHQIADLLYSKLTEER